MEQNQAYLKLQKHLDNQAAGFPATKTGIEKRILEHIFTPEEAEVASFLSHKFEPLKTIYSRAKHLVESPEELKKILDRIQKKGGIEFKIKNGIKHYCNAPLVVGMHEFQLDRLTPEFMKDFYDYTSSKKFVIEYLSTLLPQKRTIPIAKSIQPQHNSISTFDEVTMLLQEAQEPFAIIECICRKKKSIQGKTCKVTDRKETCLALDGMAQMTLANDIGREITRDEAMSIIEQNQKDGLILQPSNTKQAESICSCCGCCCDMLDLYKTLPKPLDFWATNFYATVDQDTCEGCRTCEECCQVEAVNVSKKEKYAIVNLDRCLGCGICVSNCPTESISLLKKPSEVIPPQTREELIDRMMAYKKGRFGKWMLTGKLYFDTVRTGQRHFLTS
jgi:Pyruvate/2-oxoacid:ferredoxin oxidoreductase delta subunit